MSDLKTVDNLITSVQENAWGAEQIRLELIPKPGAAMVPKVLATISAKDLVDILENYARIMRADPATKEEQE